MEALAIYPPCGRRKVMLSHEGKMYGRNELIARYIKLRTGKTRTRKQVSSHLQVLSRRKEREKQMKLKQEHVGDKLTHSSVIPPPPPPSELPPPLRPPLAYAPTLFWPPPPPSVSQPGTSEDVKPVINQRLQLVQLSAFTDQSRDDKVHRHLFVHLEGLPPYADPLLETVDIRQIHDKFPEKGGLKELYDRGPENAFYLIKFWADLNMNAQDEEGSFYGVNSEFESKENMTITCSTKVCSFGNIVVEKVKTGYARFEGGKFVYKIHNPMCEYMINFICKLRHLPEKYMMNSVLENFTILEVVTNRETQETLLCIAYVFEVSSSEFGAQHHVYRLARD